MGFVSDVISGIGNAVVGVIKGVADIAGDVIKGVGNAISGVVKFVGNTVESILKDPLPTLLQIGGAMVGIPPYVTAAVITAAKGGNLEDMAKSAAISYATTSFMSDTQIGADIKNYTSNAFAGDFTDAMMEKFNLPMDTAVQISKVATSSMNSALVGGINAALTGKPIGQSIASGFTSGLVYASTDSYFDSLNKDPNWGFSSQALNLMKGATSTALNTIVSGKGDPSQALGNYIAYATINLGGTTLANAAKDAYKLLTTDTNAAKSAQDKYTAAKLEYDTKVTAGEKLRNEINTDAAAYDKKITDEFNPFKTNYDALLATNTEAVNTFNDQKKIFDDNKWAYDNYAAKVAAMGLTVAYDDDGNITGSYKNIPNGPMAWDNDNGWYQPLKTEYGPTKDSFATAANAAGVAANAAAEKANSSSTEAKTLYDNNKTMLDSIETGKTAIDKKVADLTVIRTDIEDASVAGSTAATLKAAADAYQTKYDAWAKTKDAADRSAENYTKALAEVATRDATIDALNTNAISVTSKDADGNWALSNGMTLTTQGKFMQDGAQVFTSAAGIPQKVMDFKAADGSNVDFDDNAGRLLSETDVVNICKRDYGFTPTEAEVNAIAGGTYNLLGNDDINDLADKKATDTYFSVVGKDPTETQLETIRKSGKVVDSAADLAINGLDLPADYVSPGASVQQKVSFGQAYAAARAAYGNGKVFEWNGKQYTTENKQEQDKRFDKYLTDAQNRINLMPANTVAGAGQGFLGGKPAGAENIYYGKKDDNVYVDTRKFDAMGNVTSGTLTLADDKTATNVRATGILGQMAATGAQGIGEYMQNISSAAAALTGTSYDNVAYNLGKSIEQWGKNKDGASVAQETKNIENAITKASKEDFFTAIQTISKAAYDNPLGFISATGKEVVQEGPGLALGAVATAFMGPMGIPTAIAVRSAISASLDGLESLGSGAKETYDALKAKGVSESEARDKALMVGSIHAAVTIPAEFIGDKLMLGHYLKGITGGVKEVTAKFGSTVATNFASEYVETFAQNATTQFVTTGKIDTKQLNAESFYSGMIGAGTAATIISPASVNNLAVVAKDYSGNNVTFQDLMNGAKNVNLSTLNSSAEIGKSNNGGSVTLGALTAVGADIGLSDADLKTFLPASVTDDSSVVYKSANGTAVTLGNIDAMVEKNPLLNFKTVLDTVYTIGATDFDVLFTPSVLNGAADLKIDPTFIDQLSTDSEEALQIAKSLGYPNPSQEVLNSLTGPISEADSKAKLVDFLAGVSALQDGAPISAADAQEIMKDLGLTTMSDADAISLATKIVQSVPADKLTPDPKIQLAKDAGFPDVATYTQYDGDIGAYNTAQAAATNLATAKAAGFPDYENYNLYKGDINAFNTANANAANLTTAKAAGFPDYAAYTQYKGDVTAYNNATTAAANAQKATDAGFPDYATYTQYNGNKAVYTAALSDASNTALATKAGFPDFNTYTLYGGNKNAYDTALTDTANTQKATAAGFPNYAAYTQYGGDVKAYNADSAAKIAGWKDAAEQTKANTAGYTDPATYATYLTNTANTQKATTAGFPDYGTYTQFNGDLAAYNASKLTAETTKAINNAIAGIQFPAGITAADVAAQVKAALAANPNLTVADVTGSIRAYMTANPGLSAADVNTAIASATKDLATKKDIDDAISGITFPAGLSKADVAAEIKAAMDANPGITAADVTKAITTYMTANPGVSATDVSTAINAATKDLATNASMTTALAGVTADVKAKFDALTQGQKDVVAAYTKQGVDINKAINDSAKLTTEQITNVKTQLTALTGDVKTKFDALTKSQQDIVTSQVQLGVDLNKAIDDAAKTTSEQITNVRTDLTKDITNVQTQFNARVDELMKQGSDYKTATDTALKELGTGVSGLQSGFDEYKKQQEAAAKEAAIQAKRATSTSSTARNLAGALSLIAPATTGLKDTTTPGFRNIGLKTTGEAKFEGPLEQFLKMVKEGDYSPNPTQQETQQQNQQVAPVQDELSTPQPKPQEGSDYFNYGQQTDINDLLGGNKTPELPFKAGGLATPLFAGGGTTRHGRYAGGGLNLVHHSGKPRLDFRTGNAVTGPGDGQSDDIPAMLADGEFVFPADVVAALGNGSTKAGSDKLYDMMHSIRAYHRSAKPKDLPPPAKKSPLDYLKKRTARR